MPSGGCRETAIMLMADSVISVSVSESGPVVVELSCCIKRKRMQKCHPLGKACIWSAMGGDHQYCR